MSLWSWCGAGKRVMSVRLFVARAVICMFWGWICLSEATIEEWVSISIYVSVIGADVIVVAGAFVQEGC